MASRSLPTPWWARRCASAQTRRLDRTWCWSAGRRSGRGAELGANAVLGGDPQYLGYAGERSYLEIGDDNDIRELAVIQRSAKPEGRTKIGAHNLIMAQVHVAHDCAIGDHTIIASLTGLAGHVEVGDWAVVGGVTGVHQFVRIGAYSMVGGSSRLSQERPAVYGRGRQPSHGARLECGGVASQRF